MRFLLHKKLICFVHNDFNSLMQESIKFKRCSHYLFDDNTIINSQENLNLLELLLLS